jgi:hypothetical protein
MRAVLTEAYAQATAAPPFARYHSISNEKKAVGSTAGEHRQYV